MMTPQETDQFFCSVIDKFLSKAVPHISQKAVIQGTIALGVQSGTVVAYLSDKLQPHLRGEAPKDSNPLTMMFAVLALAQSQYEKLKSIPVAKEE